MLLRLALFPVLLAALTGAVPAKTPAVPPRPAGVAAADGKLPADILCNVYGDSYCKGSSPQPAPAQPSRGRRRRRQDQGAEPADVDPEQLCSIFGGPTCPVDKQNIPYESCACPTGGCECVPYYLCNNETGTFNKYGEGVIDIRQKQDRDGYDSSAPDTTCKHYLSQCCIVREGGVVDPTPTPNPGPPVTDWSAPPDPYPTPRPGPGPGPGPTPIKKPKCGVRYPRGIGNRIAGDVHDETEFGEITWMVAIFRKRQAEQDYLCGGGLIAENVVLTAAHCVDDKQPSNLRIRAGEWDSRTVLEMYRHQDRDVSEIIVHPDYKTQSLHNDVALLVLSEPVRLGHHIGTICLPEQGQSFDHNTCLVSGWGKTVFGKEGVYQNILRRIDDLPVVPHADCQQKLRSTRLGPYFRLNWSFMCAGGKKGRDACTGDGGSPLACPIASGSSEEITRYQFAGIVAWGVGCGEEDVPGVYADVAKFRDWINDQLSSRYIALPGIDD